MGTTPQRGALASQAWLRRFVGTTPGVIAVIAVVVVASCVAAGLVCRSQLDARSAAGRSVLDRSEPLASSAQQLYAALSAADASAATAFLSAGIETTEMRARYQRALADAAAALADTTAGAPDPDTRRALAQTSAQLTTYAGLVESAQANNRQRFVVGSSYFREASSLMQTSMLPGAKKVYAANVATLGDDQRAAGSPPVASLVALGLALAVVGASALILVGRTNRRFNLGLVGAASAVVLMGAWVVVATHMAASDIERSRTEGTARLVRLGDARIAAEQARTDETLELIAHTDITSREASFTGHLGVLSAQLAADPSLAAEAVVRWTGAHRTQVQAYDDGDYLGAVTRAIGTDPSGSAAQFARVETSVRVEIEDTRAGLRRSVAAADAWLAWSPTGTLALGVLAAAVAGIGLWPRLEEFL